MSADINAAHAATANEGDAPTDDAPEHTLKATLALAQEIREALDAVEVCEDVWSEVAISSKSTAGGQAVASFTVEGDGGLYYTVSVTPKPE